MGDLNRQLAIIVLAAGASTRLGQSKQLVNVNAEKTLIQRQCQLALELTDNVYCVIGCQATRIQQEIADLPVYVIENKRWQRGLSSSIAAGVNALNKEIDAVMLLLVDQWQLNAKHLDLLVTTWLKNNEYIIVATSDKAKGPPVIFPQAFFQSLSQLQSGDGARSVIQQNRSSVIDIELPPAFVDLDTPEQLAIFYQHFNAVNS